MTIARSMDHDEHLFLPTTETAVPIVSGPGEGKTVGVLGDYTIFKVTSEQTGGAYAVVEQTIQPGQGPPLHVHRHESEVFYILEGSFEVTVGEEKVMAEPGSLLVAPRDIPHTFRNVGDAPGRFLLTILPGNFSNFFLEVDGVEPGDNETVAALCAKYGVEVLG